MNDDEIVAEVKAVRAKRRARGAGQQARSFVRAGARHERRGLGARVGWGTPYRLIEAAAGDVELVTSPALLAELRGVLAREHLASRLAKQRSSIEATTALYAQLAINVSPLVTPRVVPGDVDDDHVVAAVGAAGADLVVSGDRDLLAISAYQRIDIVAPAEAGQARRA